MAATQRSQAQIDHDRAEIARRYLRGEIQSAIGQALGMTQQMVSYDLKAIEREWQAAAVHDLSEAKARELAKIDHLEVTYWEAWESSREDKEIATQKQTGSGDAAKRDVTLRKEGQAGSPAFLTGVQWCIERRCKLLGLDAPVKNEFTGAGGGPVTVQVLRGVSMEDL